MILSVTIFILFFITQDATKDPCLSTRLVNKGSEYFNTTTQQGCRVFEKGLVKGQFSRVKRILILYYNHGVEKTLTQEKKH